MTGPYWTDTFNPVVGCTEASPGCANCWARQMHERFHVEPFSDVHVLPSVLSKPLRRRALLRRRAIYQQNKPFEKSYARLTEFG